MDERKIKILNTIIKSYIDSKEPVGSRALSKLPEIGVSAATIRNEMADLEELGYLEKLHTSSGRIPSNEAYRQYVDAILTNKIPIKHRPVSIYDMSNMSQSEALDTIIGNAIKMLADISGYTALALLPEMTDVYLKYINIVYLSPKELVIIYIYNSKEVISDSIRLKQSIDRHTLDLVNSLLNSSLINKKRSEILEELHSTTYEVLRRQHTVLDEIIPVIEKTTSFYSEDKVLYEGLDNIYTYNKDSVENNLDLINYLKTDNSLMEILTANMDSDLQVYIGEEIGIEEFKEFSIITMTFTNGKGVKGKIGILGPNSMTYDKVLADLTLINRYINGHIERR